jgi:hypothetical protein
MRATRELGEPRNVDALRFVVTRDDERDVDH